MQHVELGRAATGASCTRLACSSWMLILSSYLVTAGAPDLITGASLKLERHGQDTTVRRKIDEQIVFTTSVDDTSSGTDTDSDITGDEEFFHGCLWTFRQQVELCEGGSCGKAEVMAHDLQRKLLAFYKDRSSPARPPLDEAAWLVLGTSREGRRELFESCPGLVVTVLLLMAEVSNFVGSHQSGSAYAQEAEFYVASLELKDPVALQTMFDMFPVREAWDGNLQLLATLGGHVPSVDIVIAACNSPLQWLWEYDLPARARVLVYDKCHKGVDKFDEEMLGLKGVASVEYRPVGEAPGSPFMTGECTAYLAHILRGLGGEGFADYTVFMHDDGPRHIRLSMLSLVLRSICSGTYRVPFLHLTHEKYPSFRTPCLLEVYKRVFGEDLENSLGTYCCSHFVVSRDRIEAHGLSFFERLRDMIAEGQYSKANGGACKVGSKPCYVMEFLWHRIFGEPSDMPPRSEDGSLPLALRYEGGRASQMPSPLKVSPYMAFFQPGRYSSGLMQRQEEAERQERSEPS